jgi:hypothetical protein
MRHGHQLDVVCAQSTAFRIRKKGLAGVLRVVIGPPGQKCLIPGWLVCFALDLSSYVYLGLRAPSLQVTSADLRSVVLQLLLLVTVL